MDTTRLLRHPEQTLRIIKIAHTAIWAFFAGCIVLIVPFAWAGNFTAAAILVGVVMVEVAVLMINHLRCPLTAMAARFTADRRDNFDIYLPLWLARYNKQVFGTLFLLSIIFLAARWLRWI